MTPLESLASSAVRTAHKVRVLIAKGWAREGLGRGWLQREGLVAKGGAGCTGRGWLQREGLVAKGGAREG